MDNRAAYTELEARFRRHGVLQGAAGLLGWDSQTMMPSGGADNRAEQSAALALVCHELLTDPAVSDLLDGAETNEAVALDDWQTANLAEMRRRWVHANALDGPLVEALTKATMASEMYWREARPANDFDGFAGHLETVLGLVREVAAAKAAALDCSPYDALLDEFEPHGKSADIDVLFARLTAFLPGFLGRVMEHQAGQPPILDPEGPFAVDDQRALGLRMMTAAGFDFDHGRLDVSDHPFTGGAPDDVRITTRYHEEDFTRSLMAVMHETGHAMYERGLPAEWRYQPIGESAGMSLHESQSLLLEMQACRSRAFIDFAAPLMRDAFGGSGPAWEADNLYRLYTRVTPGLIRVDADEVTYPAHIMLRYRLETALVADNLAVADLPGAWNDGMAELLGITPPDDRDGCLQDIHWAAGAFGYFPTYTMGALTAAQVYAAARQADGDIEVGLGRGDFTPLFRWLGTNIHGRGASLTPTALLTRATGKPLDAAVFEAHLEARYLAQG